MSSLLPYILLLLTLLCGPLPAGAQVSMIQVRLREAKLISNDSMGNEWTVSARVRSGNQIYHLTDTEPVSVPLSTGGKIELSATATEHDQYPDSGTGLLEITLDDLIGRHQHTVEIDVVVREGHGRYKGQSARWRFIFIISQPGKT